MIPVICLLIILQSSCIGAKEDYLGNNIYLSEYDNEDRRILYQEESFAVSAVEIVPMTVMEIAHNSAWIIVKSGGKRHSNNARYWVIKNNYNTIPDSKVIKENTIEFDDYNLFKLYLVENNINLTLKEIK
jgi:hypothetical protein